MSEIDRLKREGRHAEAAALLLARGEPGPAAELFAAVWEFPRAVDAALAAGAPVEAYRHALGAKERPLVERVLELLVLDAAAARAAVPLALARGQLRDAAQLSAAAGELAAAARHFEQAGELAAAAELVERAGDVRAAGRLYERHLATHEDDVAARLALGRILARFGRTEPAIQHLQRVHREADDPAARQAAGRLIVRAFDQLGLTEAAARTLDALRGGDPSLPGSVAELLAREGLERAEHEETLLAGRYRVCRTLGAGGTGRVLLAEDSFFAREVAIKVLSTVEGPKGRDALVRFAREARLSAALEHPNVVRVLDYVPEGPYLVMEWMAGGTLEERLFASAEARAAGLMVPLAPGVVRHVLVSVLAALSAAHRRGVVHRDVKPANVFFGAVGEVKLGDFGAAHLLDLGATRTGALIGTLAYMAPEQIASSSALHPATDLYALGVLAHAMITGALPFPGPDFVEQHLSAPPPPLSRAAPAWLAADPASLAALESLLLGLLAKSPDERPESALAVIEALDRLPWPALERAHGGAEARPQSVPVPEPTAPTTAAGRYVPLPEAGRGGPARARDELLGREVELVTLEGAARAALLRFASLTSPDVQAVYGLVEPSDPASPIVLEALEPPAEVDRSALARAVAALEAAGLGHGSLARSIASSAGRTVLRLPLGAGEEPDRAALARLFGPPSEGASRRG
jgi:tetratricopeptide (TPR) repeat protein